MGAGWAGGVWRSRGWNIHVSRCGRAPLPLSEHINRPFGGEFYPPQRNKRNGLHYSIKAHLRLCEGSRGSLQYFSLPLNLSLSRATSLISYLSGTSAIHQMRDGHIENLNILFIFTKQHACTHKKIKTSLPPSHLLHHPHQLLHRWKSQMAALLF